MFSESFIAFVTSGPDDYFPIIISKAANSRPSALSVLFHLSIWAFCFSWKENNHLVM